VIVDTGSTDGTQDIIKEFMKDVPGELAERPWVDFAYNRNEALDLSRKRGDYSLFIDADEQFIPSPDLRELPTSKDCYFIRIKEKMSFHERCFLLKNSQNIFWKGVLHEGVYSEEKQDEELFQKGEILSLTEYGNRSSDPMKYKKDAWILEEALKKEPNNRRYAFFLAQSYSNAKEYALALDSYRKRSEMGGEEDEVFFSLFMIGALQEQLGFDLKICAESFLKAHKFRPYRHEPLYGIAVYYVKNGRYQEAYYILNKCINFHYPEDSIFVQTHIRDYLIPYLFIECCYCLKKYDECFIAGEKLLSIPGLPLEIAQKVKINLSKLKTEIPHLDIEL
jgi:glycosyltransferase involved in cell wall biosynthesis